jgi:hypothetical protein
MSRKTESKRLPYPTKSADPEELVSSVSDLSLYEKREGSLTLTKSTDAILNIEEEFSRMVREVCSKADYRFQQAIHDGQIIGTWNFGKDFEDRWCLQIPRNAVPSNPYLGVIMYLFMRLDGPRRFVEGQQISEPDPKWGQNIHEVLEGIREFYRFQYHLVKVPKDPSEEIIMELQKAHIQQVLIQDKLDSAALRCLVKSYWPQEQLVRRNFFGMIGYHTRNSTFQEWIKAADVLDRILQSLTQENVSVILPLIFQQRISLKWVWDGILKPRHSHVPGKADFYNPELPHKEMLGFTPEENRLWNEYFLHNGWENGYKIETFFKSLMAQEQWSEFKATKHDLLLWITLCRKEQSKFLKQFRLRFPIVEMVLYKNNVGRTPKRQINMVWTHLAHKKKYMSIGEALVFAPFQNMVEQMTEIEKVIGHTAPELLKLQKDAEAHNKWHLALLYCWMREFEIFDIEQIKPKDMYQVISDHTPVENKFSALFEGSVT